MPPGLAGVGTGEPEAFAEFLTCSTSSVATFHNLGKDALLVSPCAVGDLSVYPHFAAFIRGAPEAQIVDLWRAVGQGHAQQVSSSFSGQARGSGAPPVWLSTSGLGVYWLHCRMDSRPKYYTYYPFRQWPWKPR